MTTRPRPADSGRAMRPTTDVPYQTHTEPEDGAGAWPGSVGGGEPDRSVEGLHYGRAWHRYRYCYRRAEPLRVLPHVPKALAQVSMGKP